jgi:uncharacterized membrane protein
MANGLFRNKHRDYDPVWHVQLVMVLAIVLQWVLPSRYSVGSHYLLPVVEALLIIALGLTTPRQRVFRSLKRRINAFLLIIIASAANAYALGSVINQLLTGTKAASNGKELILAAINIYLTNIIIFGLWYWEMDGGGPGQRAEVEKHEHDFLFPQQQNESYQHPKWRPTFVDYLYVSSTNAMAFSPTDTLPLSRRTKMLMLAQAALSLVTVALVAARAVTILH